MEKKTGFGCNLGPGQELFPGRVRESETPDDLCLYQHRLTYRRSEVLWVKTRSAVGQSCQTNKRLLLKTPPSKARRLIPVLNARDQVSPAEKREFPVALWLTPRRSTYSIFKANTTISASCSHKQPTFLNIDPPLACC